MLQADGTAEPGLLDPGSSYYVLIHRTSDKVYSRKPVYSFANPYALGLGQRENSYGIRLITYRFEHQRKVHERSTSSVPQSLRHCITGFRITPR
jgi:hypothetical protein